MKLTAQISQQIKKTIFDIMMTKMHDICNEQFTTSMLDSTNQLRLWLLEKLQ